MQANYDFESVYTKMGGVVTADPQIVTCIIFTRFKHKMSVLLVELKYIIIRFILFIPFMIIYYKPDGGAIQNVPFFQTCVYI